MRSTLPNSGHAWIGRERGAAARAGGGEFHADSERRRDRQQPVERDRAGALETVKGDRRHARRSGDLRLRPAETQTLLPETVRQRKGSYGVHEAEGFEGDILDNSSN